MGHHVTAEQGADGFALAVPPTWTALQVNPQTLDRMLEQTIRSNPDMKAMEQIIRQQAAAGMKFLGMWQERCLDLVKELSHEGDYLFIGSLSPLLREQPDGIGDAVRMGDASLDLPDALLEEARLFCKGN